MRRRKGRRKAAGGVAEGEEADGGPDGVEHVKADGEAESGMERDGEGER